MRDTRRTTKRPQVSTAIRLSLTGLVISFLLSGCFLDQELKRSNPFDTQFQSTLDCRENDDCSKVGYCANGKCVQCRTGVDCGEGQACIENKCAACRNSNDCSDGLACVNSVCQACKSSAECGSSLVCRESRCIPCASESPGTCILSGTITENTRLTADTTWILRGLVFVGDDVNPVILEIEPGTKILGEKQTTGALIIRRGAKIMAEGTKDKPIVFTSDQPPGKRVRGDWGGLVVNGRAKNNKCTSDSKEICEGFGEGGTGFYGGDDDNDSSGVMRYVRVEFAGRLLSPENELNGIAFQAVGAGTVLEYIQVHMAKDDGIEFFGGAANIKYALITGAADDSLDWTDGWRGKGQFIVVQQYPDDGDQGIEADNNGGDNKLLPRSLPTLANMTLVGSPQSEKSDIGILLREGTGVRIYNSIVTGFNDACLMLDQEETYRHAFQNGKLTDALLMQNTIIMCQKNFKETKTDEWDNPTAPFTVADFFSTLNTGNQLLDPLLTAPYDLDTPNFIPKSGSPALSGAATISDSFFKATSYIGGVDPKNDWTKGWTNQARN